MLFLLIDHGRVREAVGYLTLLVAQANHHQVVDPRAHSIEVVDLQTRTVELVVHTSDISLAVGRESHLPEDAVRTTLLTICAAAMLTGRGLGAVRQLSARDGSGFVLV